MSNTVRKMLNDYSHKFLPWILFSWNKRAVKKVNATEHNYYNQPAVHIAFLIDLFENLYLASGSKKRPHEVLYDLCGFSLSRQKSLIPQAGLGILVERGCVKKGSLAAMYPGTVYYPMEPILFQSINNSFILKCLGGVLIDGNDKGLSKLVYKSSAKRDVIGSYSSCDTSWLSSTQLNPLAIGQYVNNETASLPANVIYQELDIPFCFPIHLQQFLPNVNFNPLIRASEISGDEVMVRTVVLLALRDIQQGEELLSSYLTEISTK